MNTIDFSTYKFRASALPNLLSNGRGPEGLSMTAKDYVRAEWIFATFKRERFVITKYMTKGTIVESDSLSLLETVSGITYFKNKEKFENEFTLGTPDVIEDDFILDIKSSWDIYSFAAVDFEKAYKDYYGQMLGYMWLTGKTKAQLVYCLVNTPETIIEKEINRLVMSGTIKEDDESIANAKYSYLFDDIDPKLRIKVFDFDLDEEVKEKLINRIELAREYMKELTL